MNGSTITPINTFSYVSNPADVGSLGKKITTEEPPKKFYEK